MPSAIRIVQAASGMMAAGSLMLVCLAALSADVRAEPPEESRSTDVTRATSSTRRIGRLVRSPGGPDEPQNYALTDVLGLRKQIIAPDGALDLAPYVGRRVAVFGRSGFDGKSAERSFLVHRVVDMDAQPASQQAEEATGRAALLGEPTLAVLPDGPQAPAIEPLAFDEEIPPEIVAEEIPAPLVQDDSSIILDPSSVMEDVLLPPEEAIEYWDPAIAGYPAAAPFPPLWFRGEYLLWWTRGLRLPPLVTTSPAGTPRAEAGVLGESGTTVLYGNESVNGGSQSGARFRGSWWLVPETQFGVEGEYFWLGEQSDSFRAQSDGSEILARPFFDILNGRETAELISFPTVVRGTVTVDALTRLHSGGIWFRRYAPSRRLDFLLGYRYMRLEDDIVIGEDLVSLDTSFPGSFVIEDAFRTDNTFHGVELGILHEGVQGPFFLELLGKIALGNNRQEVTIDGHSNITEGGVTQRYQGGLLAQRTNIGQYSRDAFAVVPQLGATLGWRITRRLSLTAGYTLLYLSNVVRAGDQIDLVVNPNLLPPEADPLTGALRPEFVFRESDFWAHGVSFGGDLRW